MVFHAVLASSHGDPLYQVGQFLISVAIGVAGAVIGTALLWFCLRKLDLGEVLGTTTQLAAWWAWRPPATSPGTTPGSSRRC